MWKNALFFMLLLGLVGCRIKLKMVALEVPLPETFSQSGHKALPEKWRYVLGNPGLNAVIEEALENNFTVRSAWDRLYQAEQVAIKAGAYRRPNAHYPGSANRIHQDTNHTVTYNNSFIMGLTASYEIDLWGKIDAGHTAMLLDIEARHEDVAAAAITLSASIAKTWYQLAEAKQQADTLARQIETNEKMLEIIDVKFQKGAVGAPDMFRQRQLTESTRRQLVQVREAATLLQYQLSILLGSPPQRRWEDHGFRMAKLGDIPKVAVPSELIRRRPDVISAYKTVQKVDQQVAAAIADQYPSISLTASSETMSNRIEDLFDDWAASLAGSLAGPLFDARLRRAEADRTRGVLSKAIHAYTQTVLNALKEVEDAISKETFQRETLHNIERQRELAE